MEYQIPRRLLMQQDYLNLSFNARFVFFTSLRTMYVGSEHVDEARVIAH